MDKSPIKLVGYKCDGCLDLLTPDRFAESQLPGGDGYQLGSTFCLDCIDSASREEAAVTKDQDAPRQNYYRGIPAGREYALYAARVEASRER